MPLRDYYIPLKKLWNWAPIDHLLDMNSPLESIAIFSQDVTQFAFQANLSQKNAVDIYSLDPSNNYSVNSSLVSHVDYESNDLKASEALFLGWCSSSEETGKTKTKRARSDEENGNSTSKEENFFINGFPQGKIVVFSSTGRQIINIIQIKRDILHASTESEFIWILDTGFTVKKLHYGQAKPLKSFQLTDGNNEELILFRILPRRKNVYLALASEKKLYILDPSQEQPATVAKLSVNKCTGCELVGNGEQIAVASADGVALFNISSGELVQRWDIGGTKLRVVQELIFILTADDTIAAFKPGREQCYGQVKIHHSQVIEFTQVKNALLIAWLNVNEPNFKVISLNEIHGGNDVVVHEVEGEPEPQMLEGGLDHKELKENGIDEEKNGVKIVFSRADQDELSQSLINSLDKGDGDSILTGLSSKNWTEQRIKSFIVFHINNQDSAKLIFETISSNFRSEVWNKESSLAEWLKWILTLRGDCFDNRHMRKHTKQLRSSLKNSGESLSTLISIQGRLEMLKSQAQLREDLARLNLAENDDKMEVVNHEDAAAEDNVDPDDSISYANGESDTFVDAVEH